MHGYLRHLANFAYVIEAGSISGAASKLEVSASSISDSVRILEAHIGEPLVERIRGGVRPTSRGTEMYSEATQIVGALERALHVEATDRVEGLLTISLPQEVSDNGFHEVLTLLAERHPNLRLSVLIEDALTDPSRHARDLFLRVGLGAPVQGLTQLWSRLMRIVIVGHPDLIGDIDPLDKERITQLPYLCNLRTEPGIDIPLANPDELVTFKKTLQASSHQTRLAWAREGVGLVACLSTSVENDLKEGRLIEVFPDRHIRKGMMFLLTDSKKSTPRETAVVQALIDVFGGEPGETRQ